MFVTSVGDSVARRFALGSRYEDDGTMGKCNFSPEPRAKRRATEAPKDVTNMAIPIKMRTKNGEKIFRYFYEISWKFKKISMDLPA